MTPGAAIALDANVRRIAGDLISFLETGDASEASSRRTCSST